MMLQKNSTSFLILLSLVLLMGCKNKPNQAKQSEETTAYKELTLKWGSQVQYDFNQDRSFVLAQSVPGVDSKSRDVSYFVFDMKAEKITTEGNVENGSVSWLSLKEIQIFRVPGKMSPGQSRDDYTTVVDVLTGKQTPKTNWKKG